MPDEARELEAIVSDLRQYAEKPFGSIRIDVREVKVILAAMDAKAEQKS
jgi:hypothetical protein